MRCRKCGETSDLPFVCSKCRNKMLDEKITEFAGMCVEDKDKLVAE